MSRDLPWRIPITLAAVLMALLAISLTLGPSDPPRSPERPRPGISERLETALSTSQAAEGLAAPAGRWGFPAEDAPWRLVPSRTTSTAWLYSTSTGMVYQVLAECPQAGLNGCLIQLPMVIGPLRSDEVPSAGDDE